MYSIACMNSNADQDRTTIAVSSDFRDAIKSQCQKGESYESFLRDKLNL